MAGKGFALRQSEQILMLWAEGLAPQILQDINVHLLTKFLLCHQKKGQSLFLFYGKGCRLFSKARGYDK